MNRSSPGRRPRHSPPWGDDGAIVHAAASAPNRAIPREAERMTAAVRRQARAGVADAPRPADVLVIFGITGDLAKVMTYRSLYRLERRGLLDCPVVGVAGDEGAVGHPVERAPQLNVGAGEQHDPAGVLPPAQPALHVHGGFAHTATPPR